MVQSFLKRFWPVVALLAALAFVLIIYLLLRSNAERNSSPDQIGSGGPVVFQFGFNPDPILLAEKTTIQPEVSFRWIIEDGSAYFLPVNGFRVGETYRLDIAPGQIGVNGERLNAAVQREFSVRPSRIAFLRIENQDLNLLVTDQAGSTITPLTEGGGLYDFDVSTGGGRIVYSRINAQGGYDLWMVNLDKKGENQPALLVDCGQEVCINPAFNPTDRWVAYTRMDRVQFSGNTGIGEIWTVNTVSKETAALYQSPGILGVNPQWAPDNSALSFYDHVRSGIHIIKLINGEQFFLATSQPTALAWMPDASEFFYSDQDTAEQLPVEVFFRGRLDKSQPSVIGEHMDRAFDLGTPVISPKGDLLAAGVRLVEGPPVYQLWLFDLEGRQQKAVTADFTYTHGWYSWAPDGSALVYQRYKLGSAENKPEVVVWDLATGQEKVIATSAGFPAWLP